MEIDLKIIIAIEKTLENVLLNSQDKKLRKQAYHSLNSLSHPDFIMINRIKIQRSLYSEIVNLMRKSKTDAIIKAKRGLNLEIKEAKILVEDISHKEKIPMIHGYRSK